VEGSLTVGRSRSIANKFRFSKTLPSPDGNLVSADWSSNRGEEKKRERQSGPLISHEHIVFDILSIEYFDKYFGTNLWLQ
jgi:hypothetical protein